VSEGREVIWTDDPDERLWTDEEVEQSMLELWNEAPEWVKAAIDARLGEIAGIGPNDRFLLRRPDGEDGVEFFEVTEIGRWRAHLLASDTPGADA
jgi:hypothetical protein